MKLKFLFSLLITLTYTNAYSQINLEVEGKAKIIQMDLDNSADSLVVRQTDGTLAVRDISSLGGHKVGDFFGGGIIFYVYDNGQHGLIASRADLVGSRRWSATNDDVNTAEDPFDGQANKDAIIAFYPSVNNLAAHQCDNYSFGGFSDWYLPAAGELKLLFQNMYELNYILENDGNAATKIIRSDVDYWTFNQNSFSSVLKMNWTNSPVFALTKTGLGPKVRAIRKF